MSDFKSEPYTVANTRYFNSIDTCEKTTTLKSVKLETFGKCDFDIEQGNSSN